MLNNDNDFSRRSMSVWVELAVAVLVTTLNASFGRPLWIDEFLHFAYGSMPTTAVAWTAIKHSIGDINHGQTGIYMLVDYWLLSHFGASAFLLRLPSFFSGILVIFSVLHIFRLLGRSVAWQVIALLAILGQATTINYISEARPYLPLVAATVALLAYYLFPVERRTATVQAFGYVAAIWGALMHPYFAIYWPLMLFVGYTHRCLSERVPFSISGMLRHANIPMCIVGSAIWLAIGIETWLIGGPTFSLDPFQWIREPTIWRHFSNEAHFQFLGGHLIATAIITVIFVGLALRLGEHRRQTLKAIATPLLLLCGTIVLSLLVGYASYRRHYWILPRQWVASSALVAVAIVWLWSDLARRLDRISPIFGYAILIFAFGAVITQAATPQIHRIRELTSYVMTPAPATSAENCTPPASFPENLDSEQGNALWVDLANRNIACGGPVWPVFRQYYGLK